MSASRVSSAFPASPPELAPERPVAWPKRTVVTMPNGLQVVLAELRNFPRVTGELFFRSGNAEVAHRAPGLAEMTATVVRTGTASRSSRRIEEDLRRMGADLGTKAGADSSAIAFSGLAEFSEGLLALAADLAQHATFPNEEFERERRQRLEELRIERTTPGFLAAERLRRALFGDHPYAVFAPTEAQVEAYRREQLVDFYHQHYVPSNALLVLVGDLATERMLEQVEATFSSWKAATLSRSPAAAPPEIHGRRIHLVHLPGTVQAEILLGNRAITRLHADWQRLVLANSIYGGAFNSRLVMNIREQKGYTYSPRSTAHSLRLQGFFTVHAAVRNDVAAATLTEIFYEMDRMRSLPVGDAELHDARHYVSGAFSLGGAPQDGILGQLSTVYLDGLPDDYLETYRERIRSLTADDVLLAARRYFDSANAQIVMVGDVDQLAAQAALFGEVEVWNAQGNRT